ncbi:MAG: c-type cytochrome domain-containing protein [Acidobacteriaceae bacterium]
MIRIQPSSESRLRFRFPLNRKVAAFTLSVATLAVAFVLSQPHIVSAQADTTPDSVAFYTQRVQPILENNCYRCHGGFHHRGGLNMATRASFLLGGEDGPVVIPGNAEGSLLIQLIRHQGPVEDPMPMPPPPHSKLPDADIATIAQWIQAGMAMPPDPPAN